MAQTNERTIGERLDALKAPNPYGLRVYLSDTLTWDALTQLHDAAEAVLDNASDQNLARLLTVSAQVGRMRRESTG